MRIKEYIGERILARVPAGMRLMLRTYAPGCTAERHVLIGVMPSGESAILGSGRTDGDALLEAFARLYESDAPKAGGGTT